MNVSRRQTITVSLIVSSLLVAFLLGGLVFQPVQGGPVWINVSISPSESVSLGVNKTQQFKAVLAQDSVRFGPFKYAWSTSDLSLNASLAQPKNGSEYVLFTQNDSAWFTFLGATLDVWRITVQVTARGGASASAYVIVHDPYVSPDVYLDDLPSTASFVIKTDGLGWYGAVDSHGHLVDSSTSAVSVVSNALGNSTRGSTIFLKMGRYYFSSSINATNVRDVAFEGEGPSEYDYYSSSWVWYGTCIIASAGNIALFNLTTCVDVKFINLGFYAGDVTPEANIVGINATNCLMTTVEHCYFRWVKEAIHFDGAYGSFIQGNTFTSCGDALTPTVTLTATYRQNTDTHVENNWWYSDYSSSLYVAACDWGYVEHNYFEGYGAIYPTTCFINVRECNVVDNTFWCSTSGGIAAYVRYGKTVSGNYFDGGTAGGYPDLGTLSLTQGSPIVTGNNFKNITSPCYGIYADLLGDNGSIISNNNFASVTAPICWGGSGVQPSEFDNLGVANSPVWDAVSAMIYSGTPDLYYCEFKRFDVSTGTMDAYWTNTWGSGSNGSTVISYVNNNVLVMNLFNNGTGVRYFSRWDLVTRTNMTDWIVIT